MTDKQADLLRQFAGDSKDGVAINNPKGNKKTFGQKVEDFFTK